MTYGADIPDNAHMLGNSWYCDDGYQRQGNKCVRLEVPANAHVLGNSWYCDDGFSRQGNVCNRLNVPNNAHVLGNSWYCDDGYQRRGGQCVNLIVPENAHVLGNSWYCDDGFKRVGDSCSRMTEEERARLETFLRERKAQQIDGTVAFVTKIDSDHGNVLKLENGAIVEITSGHLEYIGYRKKAILFRGDNSCQIAIEGKRTYKCDVLKLPDERGKSAKQLHITEIRGQGTILLTLDGDIYEVDAIDQITSSIWLGIFDALLIEGNQLINLDTGESVDVHRFR